MPAGRENRVSGPTVSSQTPVVGRDEIAGRAYQLYLERGGTDGHDVDDWLHAEEQLAREQQQRQISRPQVSSSEAA